MTKKPTLVYKARKKRAVRGVVATYLREISAAGRQEAVPAAAPAKA